MYTQRYIKEINTFLSRYDISEEQKFKITNIFESYIRSIINTLDEYARFDILSLEPKIRKYITNYEDEITKIINNTSHITLLNYILSNKSLDVSFSLEDEEKMYNEIIDGTFDIEVYCLSYSNYDNLCALCAILHAIANKLGFSKMLKEKSENLNIYTDQDKEYEKLKDAIKMVE